MYARILKVSFRVSLLEICSIKVCIPLSIQKHLQVCLSEFKILMPWSNYLKCVAVVVQQQKHISTNKAKEKKQVLLYKVLFRSWGLSCFGCYQVGV
jgi:hypothetical protein